MTKVMMAHPLQSIDPKFYYSLIGLKDWDWQHDQHLAHKDWFCGAKANNLASLRNRCVRTFLATDCEWLWFIDTDQTFAADTLDRMLESADPVERPILSALIMARREDDKPLSPACVGLDDEGRLRRATAIPAYKHWPCMPGTGCVLIHRSVLEKLGEQNKDKAFPWFEFAEWRYTNDEGEDVLDVMGEDYTFMIRANAAGFPSFVDTTIEAGHLKQVEYTTLDFYRENPQALQAKTYVVIPVKDQLKMTKALVRQLREQGGYDGIFIYDNGSNPETKRWLASQKTAEVFDAAGQGIHSMWQAGADQAIARWPKSNVVFLNNDLKLGEGFLDGLCGSLRAGPDNLVTVSPNYDGRELEGLQQVNQICANRYDGTGGLAGFAFAVKGEWFQSGYQFPTFLKWWYGDNHFLLSILAVGGIAAITSAATVEHLDGGGQTGDWEDPDLQIQLKADRDAFERWYREQAA